MHIEACPPSFVLRADGEACTCAAGATLAGGACVPCADGSAKGGSCEAFMDVRFADGGFSVGHSLGFREWHRVQVFSPTLPNPSN